MSKKPNLTTPPIEWVKNPNTVLVYRDENSDALVTFKEHFERNDQTGEMEPAYPPQQDARQLHPKDEDTVTVFIEKDGQVIESADVPSNKP